MCFGLRFLIFRISNITSKNMVAKTYFCFLQQLLIHVDGTVCKGLRKCISAVLWQQVNTVSFLFFQNMWLSLLNWELRNHALVILLHSGLLVTSCKASFQREDEVLCDDPNNRFKWDYTSAILRACWLMFLSFC